MQRLKTRITNPSYLFLFYFLLYLFLPLPEAEAQFNYQLSKGKDIPLLGAGLAGTTTSILLRTKNKPLTVDDVGKLKATDIFAVDRSATSNYGANARVASDVLLLTSNLLPLTTLFVPEVRGNVGTVAIMLAETMLINETLTGITKAVVRRPRPFTYNQDVPENVRTSASSNYSFFSGHTSYTAALSFFTAKVISDQINNGTTKAFVWTGAALLPAATGFFRYKAGMHFPTDVLVGYLVGAATGYFIPQLHKKKDEPENKNQAHTSLNMISPTMFSFVIVF